MLKDEVEYTVRAVNEAGTCISTAYLTVLPAATGERTAKELIEQESLMTLETRRRSPRRTCLQRHFRFVSAQDIQRVKTGNFYISNVMSSCLQRQEHLDVCQFR